MSKKIAIPEQQPITPNEAAFMAELKSLNRELLARTYVSDMTILRFIRGYVNEPNYAESVRKHFADMLQWRIESRVDALASAPLPRREEFVRVWPHGLHGISKCGHIVYIDRPAQVDPSTFGQRFSFSEYEKLHIQQMELLCDAKDRLGAKLGRNNYKHIVIMDLEGFTMKHFSKKFYEPIQKLLAIDQTKYPETLHKMFVVNSPFLFRAAWAVVSPWVDPITRSRIEFCKVKELLDHIDANQLPKELGGTCVYSAESPCFVNPFQCGGEYDSIFSGLLEGRRNILIERGLARAAADGTLEFADAEGNFQHAPAPAQSPTGADGPSASSESKGDEGDDEIDPALLAAVEELKVDGLSSPTADLNPVSSPVVEQSSDIIAGPGAGETPKESSSADAAATADAAGASGAAGAAGAADAL